MKVAHRNAESWALVHQPVDGQGFHFRERFKSDSSNAQSKASDQKVKQLVILDSSNNRHTSFDGIILLPLLESTKLSKQRSFSSSKNLVKMNPRNMLHYCDFYARNNNWNTRRFGKLHTYTSANQQLPSKSILQECMKLVNKLIEIYVVFELRRDKTRGKNLC